MKSPRHKPASIPRTRWASYVTTAAATALAGSQSAEAAIHYSGRLNVPFNCGTDYCVTYRTFQLDQPGDYFSLFHYINSYHHGIDYCFINGIASAANIGTERQFYISKLSFGQAISQGNFGYARVLTLFGQGPWREKPGPRQGFIGFRFNNGAGVQYGWARVQMGRLGQRYDFALFDYAYADPGEPLRAGQISTEEQAPHEGSLGWLALGAAGLLAWRKSRSRTARYTKPPLPI